MRSSRPLVRLAWCNVVLHVLAVALAAVGMRPGSPLVPLEERLRYLAGSPVTWLAAWIVWMLCALALIAFLAVLAQQLDALARLGLIVAIVGAGFDLCCDSIYLVVLPELAMQHVSNELFLTVERMTNLASLAIANGAYSIAILLCTIALQPRRGWAIWTGYGVAAFGLVLAAAGFTGSAWLAAVATLPTIGLFCVWVLLVARSVEGVGRMP